MQFESLNYQANMIYLANAVRNHGITLVKYVFAVINDGTFSNE